MSIKASQVTKILIVCSTVFQSDKKRSNLWSILLVLCEGNKPVTGGFPSQRAINVESVYILWHHHDSDDSIKQGKEATQEYGNFTHDLLFLFSFQVSWPENLWNQSGMYVHAYFGIFYQYPLINQVHAFVLRQWLRLPSTTSWVQLSYGLRPSLISLHSSLISLH